MASVTINGQQVDLEEDAPPHRPPPPTAAELAQRAAEQERRRLEALAWPRTLKEAVAAELQRLSPELKTQLRSMSAAQLVDLHFGYGLFLRNTYGLWGGNKALRQDCGAADPDTCSGVIMHAVWQALVDGAP